MKQNRFASKIAWVTLLPVIILIGDTYGLFNIIGMDSNVFTKIYMGILTALAAFGIFNNPTDSENF